MMNSLDRRERSLWMIRSQAAAGMAPADVSTVVHHPGLSVSSAPLAHSILSTDVVAFGDRRRDDNDRSVVREALHRMLREVFDASRVPWSVCHHEDRGDGILTVVPPTVPTVALVDPLIALLAAKLRRHNRQAGDPVRIQLRFAMHVGPVSVDPEGLSGHALIHTARMLDAPVLRHALAAGGADLGVIASDQVYDTVIRHTVGLIDPAEYRPVRIRLKETNTGGWMYLTGGQTAADPGFSLGSALHARLSAWLGTVRRT